MNCVYDIDDVVKCMKSLSDQLKQLTAEQRRTSELLKAIKKELSEGYTDADYLPS